MREINHPNVIRAKEIITINYPKQSYIIMEYIELVSLRTLIDHNKKGLK